MHWGGLDRVHLVPPLPDHAGSIPAMHCCGRGDGWSELIRCSLYALPLCTLGAIVPYDILYHLLTLVQCSV